jgi:hypothetical protein
VHNFCACALSIDRFLLGANPTSFLHFKANLQTHLKALDCASIKKVFGLNFKKPHFKDIHRLCTTKIILKVTMTRQVETSFKDYAELLNLFKILKIVAKNR